jgi:hypothetical protein
MTSEYIVKAASLDLFGRRLKQGDRVSHADLSAALSVTGRVAGANISGQPAEHVAEIIRVWLADGAVVAAAPTDYVVRSERLGPWHRGDGITAAELAEHLRANGMPDPADQAAAVARLRRLSALT